MSTTKLKTAFELPFYVVKDVLSQEENDKLKYDILTMASTQERNGGTGWFSGPKSPKTNFEVFSLDNHNEFDLIKQRITSYVNKFASEEYNSIRPFESTEGWYNVYNKENLQEFHIHPMSVFSAIYYCSFPDGSSPTVFKSPVVDMFPPFPFSSPSRFSNDNLVMYPPGERSLIIFRSFIMHMVPTGDNDKTRITMSYNFA